MQLRISALETPKPLISSTRPSRLSHFLMKSCQNLCRNVFSSSATKTLYHSRNAKAASVRRLLSIDASSLCGERVAAVGKTRERRILQIDRDGRVFHIAFALDALHYFVTRKRSFTFENPFDDIAHDPRLITPFLERIESAADKDEAVVFDELVVRRRGMSLTAEKLLDTARNFCEVHRRAVALQREVRKIARVLDADVRAVESAPLAERVPADALRDGEPAEKYIVRAILYTFLLQVAAEEFDELVFRCELVRLD